MYKLDNQRDAFPWENLTGYQRLLRDGIGDPPKLPEHLEAKCREAIAIRYPGFFNQPFAVLLLRRSGLNSKIYDTRIRDAGPDENYLSSVKYLTSQGYAVVGEGGTCHDVFSSVAGYYDLSDLGVPPALVNLWVLTNCQLYIGQHSGAYMVPNSCGARVCMTDTGTFLNGTFCRDDLIVFKRAWDTVAQRWLSPVEIFTNHFDLALTYGFEERGISLEPNTPEEILGAVTETIESMEGRLGLSEDDNELCRSFASIIPASTLLHFEGNRTSLEILRANRKALLEAYSVAAGGERLR